MTTHQSHVEELKRSSQLPAVIEELNRFWTEEQQRRQQFYADLDEDIKAEFIEGEVVVHSPVRDPHNMAVRNLTAILTPYTVLHDLGALRMEKALIALPRNSFEPDLCFFRKARGLEFGDDYMYYPAPDWVCEVLSPGTERYDRGVKKTDYALNGVQEYWIVDPKAQTVEQYLLEEGDYALAFKSGSGELRSAVFTGLALPVAAIFDERMATQLVGTFYTQN